MFMAPANVALGAEAHDSGRQYKQREMCFSLPSGIVTIPGLCVVRARRGTTAGKVWSAAEPQRVCLQHISGMFALTGWVTGEDSLLQTGDIFNRSLMIIVCTWGKFTLSGHWWKMCHASRCSSWGCRKRMENGALQGLGGCGEECLTSGLLSCELNWFNVRTNHKSQSVWKIYSCQSTFSRKLALIFSKKKTKPESLLWNRGTIYKKILLPTSWSFLSC